MLKRMRIGSVFPSSWFRKSRLLDEAAFASMRRGARVLEQDGHGIKVLQLPGGEMLKLFRVKHRVSSARLYSHARSFCRNAQRLQRLGVQTVGVQQLYHLERPGCTAVRYAPLEGNTLRQLAREGKLDDDLLRQLAAFVARLHDCGIYFRSLHLGNVVLTPRGELGLIDVSDITILPWRLPLRRRLRNFRHICRLEEDRQLIGCNGWMVFCEAYLAAAGGLPLHKMLAVYGGGRTRA